MKDLIVRYMAIGLNKEETISGEFYVVDRTFDNGKWHILLASACPTTGVDAIGIHVPEPEE